MTREEVLSEADHRSEEPRGAIHSYRCLEGIGLRSCMSARTKRRRSNEPKSHAWADDNRTEEAADIEGGHVVRSIGRGDAREELQQEPQQVALQRRQLPNGLGEMLQRAFRIVHRGGVDQLRTRSPSGTAENRARYGGEGRRTSRGISGSGSSSSRS